MSCIFPRHKLIWQTWVHLKVKIFFWLVFRQCHWTTEKREAWSGDTHKLPYKDPETCNHLFASCTVTMQVWYEVFAALGVNLSPPRSEKGGTNSERCFLIARKKVSTHYLPWSAGKFERRETSEFLEHKLLHYLSC